MLGISFKGQQKPVPQGGAGAPAQRVLALSSQGMSEPEITRTLQQEGYSPIEVDRAMKDAMRSSAARGPQRMGPPAAPSAPGMQNPSYQQGAPYQRQAPPAPSQQSFGEFDQPQPFSKNKFAPTDWSEDGELPEDDLDMQNVPKERRLGPAAMFPPDIDEDKFPVAPGPAEREPLRFAEAPLPKGGDERDREVKDRRRREVEEMVEQIAEEKWQEMARRVREVEEKAEKMASDIKGASSRTAGPAPEDLSALKGDISSLRQGVEETNARIDSLEEVVKGSLTPMIDSIKRLRGAASVPEGIERPSSMQPPRQQRPSPSAMDDSYDNMPRYAPKREEKGEGE